ncbi:MAG: sugar phosphate isomerase/epimerase [Chloroflexi bacterium]|nr:sugar phosphate isomerase/epimerase [Chloroflexota bacterium]
MRHWKLCVNAGFFGAQRDVYTEYRPPQTLEAKFAAFAAMPRLDGVELKYPFDLEDVALAHRLLDETGLRLAAVNVDIKDATHFRYGALSARSAQTRALAVQRITEGMDLAAELGADLVTTCPLAEGFDYPFERDYRQAWEAMIAAVTEAADHNSTMPLCLEYQPHDMQSKPLLSNVGKALYLCQRVERPNVGINLDIGHALAAGESPAEVATLLQSAGKLFYIHTNDNPGDGGDWDLLSGSMHWWQWIELFYTLDRLGYDGWLGADIAAHQMDAPTAFGANIMLLDRMWTLAERLEPETIEALMAREGNAAQVFAYLTRDLER